MTNKTSNTLIILGHPNIEEWSHANKKIRDYLKSKYRIDFRYIGRGSTWDVEAEQKMIEQYDNIIIQYPIYWVAMPGMLKLYIDEVFNNKWAYGKKYALKGKKLGNISTAGNPSINYHAFGLNWKGVKIFLITKWSLGKFTKMKDRGSWIKYNAVKDQNVNFKSLDRYLKKFSIKEL
jgi:putative NADPH-quinone reductase